MGIINTYHTHNPNEDTLEVCDWIDAGIFSGDMLYTVDIEKFQSYLGRWKRAIEEHKKTIEGEKNVSDI